MTEVILLCHSALIDLNSNRRTAAFMNVIYLLSDPRDSKTTCYIGKTCDVERRYKSHILERNRTRKCRWIQSLAFLGLKPTLTILEDNVEDWKNAERKWILHFKELNFDVVNHTNGGDGPEFGLDEEARLRLSESVKARFLGDSGEQYRKRISENTTALNKQRKKDGKYAPLSEEHKNKLREINKGNKSRTGLKNSEQMRAAISAANKGKLKSEEWKQKASDAAKRRWQKVRLEKQTEEGENNV